MAQDRVPILVQPFVNNNAMCLVYDRWQRHPKVQETPRALRNGIRKLYCMGVWHESQKFWSIDYNATFPEPKDW